METTPESQPSDPHQAAAGGGGGEQPEKRKRDGDGDPPAVESALHPMWKTSLCSYFRRAASCSHGEGCRYAHTEAELRPRPDNSWDPTSDRAKKLKSDSAAAAAAEEEDYLATGIDLSSSSSSGGSCSPLPAADLAHSSSSAAADHQDSSEELMVITIKNQLRPATEAYSLPTIITVGALKDLLQSQVPERDFLLLQERDDGYPSALFHDTATLADCHVTHGDTLHLTSPHTFPLGLYDNSPKENCFPRNPAYDPFVKGRFIHLQPSVYYTVAHLKEIIFRITGYHPQHQLLNPLTTRLHEMDNRTLQSLGFESSDAYTQLTLYNCPPPPPNQPLPPSAPKIHILVTHDRIGGMCKVPVDPIVTVKELRSDLMIGKTTCLRFGSTVLENDKTLSDYKITHGDIIILSATW